MSSTSRSAPTTPIRTFKARTLHFLQVSPTQVVPVRLFLSAPSTFSEIVWQEILSVVQENIMEELYLSPHNGKIAVAVKYTVASPRQYMRPHLRFIYYWVTNDADFKLLVPASSTIYKIPAVASWNGKMEPDNSLGAESDDVLVKEEPQDRPVASNPKPNIIDVEALEGTAPDFSKMQLTFEELKMMNYMMVITVLPIPGKRAPDEIDLSVGVAGLTPSGQAQISHYFDSDSQQERYAKRKTPPKQKGSSAPPGSKKKSPGSRKK